MKKSTRQTRMSRYVGKHSPKIASPEESNNNNTNSKGTVATAAKVVSADEDTSLGELPPYIVEKPITYEETSVDGEDEDDKSAVKKLVDGATTDAEDGGGRGESGTNLKLHLKSHMDIRDYTCHICGRGFYRPDALKKHLLCYHANLKAFHCHICNKMFKGHLPQHMRTHLKVRPHGCAVCGSVFSQRSQLILHVTACYKDPAAVKNLDNMMDPMYRPPESNGVDPPMTISRMRFLVAILLKKISSEDRLKELGFDKRLIDNVLIDSLKCAGRKFCDDKSYDALERLKLNVQELLEWTVPPNYMEEFRGAN
uniref:C2H2-type domain-containing protein n=1 Tax=Anopheles dirus TaxID=7168 RepID=A0A182MYU7_9DIPT